MAEIRIGGSGLPAKFSIEQEKYFSEHSSDFSVEIVRHVVDSLRAKKVPWKNVFVEAHALLVAQGWHDLKSHHAVKRLYFHKSKRK